MTGSDDYFFHSFPRRASKFERRQNGISGERAREMGVDILASIFQGGIVLTPEPIRIGRQSEFSQSRASFTFCPTLELFQRRGEKLSHSERFGEFSIGIDYNSAKLLDLVPTFYCHLPSDDAGSMGSGLLDKLMDIRHLVVAIAHLEAMCCNHPNPHQIRPISELQDIGLGLNGQIHNIEAFKKFGKRPFGKKTLLKCLDTERVPGWNLAQWMDIIISAFQFTSRNTTCNAEDNLEYFHQKEWRLLSYYSRSRDCVPLFDPIATQLTEHLKDATRIALCKKFQSGYQGREQEVFVVCGASGRKFSDFISTVIAPEASGGDACSIISKYGDWRSSSGHGRVVFNRVHRQ